MALDFGFSMPIDLGAAQADFNNDFGPKGSTAQNDVRWMNDFNWKQSLRNEQFQHDLAEHGLKMRVDDAVSAGLHPLVGAGINPASGGWSGAAFNQPIPKSQPDLRSASGAVNISRAVQTTMTDQEKLLQAAELQRLLADTAESQARKALADKQLAELVNSPSSMPVPNKYQSFRNPDGSITQGYSSDYSQSIMSDPMGMWAQSLKKSFGGPDNDAFWQMFGRSALRLMHPWKRSN